MAPYLNKPIMPNPDNVTPYLDNPIMPNPDNVTPGSYCWYDCGSPQYPDWQIGRLSGWVIEHDASLCAVVIKTDGNVATYYAPDYISFAVKQPTKQSLKG